jgi:hypothetical protein
MNYGWRELCFQEVTAEHSQYNDNYFRQLNYTVTEINVTETEDVCGNIAVQFKLRAA